MFGLLRIGKLSAYIPSSVVNGMLAAIGLLLIMQQAPVALGMTTPSVGLPGAEEAGQGATFGAPLVALISLVVLFGWSSKALQRYRLVRALPAPLVVVAWGIVYSVGTL